MTRKKLSCRVMGCRWRFRAAGREVVWECARGCGRGGRHAYATPEQARKVAWHLVDNPAGPPLGMLAALAGTVPREPKEGSPEGGAGRRR